MKKKDEIRVSKQSKKPKQRRVDFSKILGIDLDDLDRIAGGMVRLEHKYRNWNAYINHCLKLAKNEKECCLCWYFIGFKAGVMASQGALIVLPGGPVGKKEDISIHSDISVQ